MDIDIKQDNRFVLQCVFVCHRQVQLKLEVFLQGCYVVLLDLSREVVELGFAWAWDCASDLGLGAVPLLGVPGISWCTSSAWEFGGVGLLKVPGTSKDLWEVEAGSDLDVCLEGDSVSREDWEPEAADGLKRSGESGRSRWHSLIFGWVGSVWARWSFVRSKASLVPGMLSLTGPSTLLATVVSWDTALSIPLSVGVDGEAAAAAACLRLSASFISLVIPPVGVVATGISLVTPEAVLGSILSTGFGPGLRSFGGPPRIQWRCGGFGKWFFADRGKCATMGGKGAG